MGGVGGVRFREPRGGKMTETKSDIELLQAWIDGDSRAGSVLVRRHFDSLYRFFANKASGYEEDLIQQTFMASVEAKDAFRGESTFRAYLFGLARFQLLTHYRKVYRRHDLDVYQSLTVWLRPGS